MPRHEPITLMDTRTQPGQKSIDQLIINSPYEEPREHWKYHRETRLFTREPERRRAGYIRASEKSRSADDPGIFVELPLVNQIRPRIKKWREADYPGATGITKRLLAHWRDPEMRDSNRRFFFCQLEAIETLMWLTEAPASERVGIEIPGDGGPFPRLWRPPYGSYNATTLQILKRLRMLMVLWTVDSEDYRRPGVPTIVDRVLAGARPGAIILMHDGGGDRSETIAALPAIVKGLRDRGLRPVTIPQLMLDDPPPPGQQIPQNLAGD